MSRPDLRVRTVYWVIYLNNNAVEWHSWIELCQLVPWHEPNGLMLFQWFLHCFLMYLKQTSQQNQDQWFCRGYVSASFKLDKWQKTKYLYKNKMQVFGILHCIPIIFCTWIMSALYFQYFYIKFRVRIRLRFWILVHAIYTCT